MLISAMLFKKMYLGSTFLRFVSELMKISESLGSISNALTSYLPKPFSKTVDRWSYILLLPSSDFLSQCMLSIDIKFHVKSEIVAIENKPVFMCQKFSLINQARYYSASYTFTAMQLFCCLMIFMIDWYFNFSTEYLAWQK